MSEYEYETIDEDGDTWPEGVRKVATHHPVLGGDDESPLNVSAKDLADRTAWAKVALGVLQSTADTHDGRLDALEGTADTHDGRLDALEGTVNALDGQLAVGSYTPTVFGSSGLLNAEVIAGHWLRTQQRVFVMIHWLANPTGSQIRKRFDVELPIPRSASFAADADASGLAVTHSTDPDASSGGGVCVAFPGSQWVRVFFDLHDGNGVTGTAFFTYSL